jgi:hypothetical protein
MTRTVCWIPAAALGLALFADGAQAQTALTVGTGAGLTIPIGDLADAQGLGWNAQGNIGVQNPGWPIALRFDVMYHSLSGEDGAVGGVQFEGRSLQIISGIANAELYVSRAANGGGLFLVGGAGIYNLDAEDDDDILETESSTDFGLVGGAGYKLAMTNLFLSIEGKFHNIFGEGGDGQLIPINVVVEIPLGGN